MLSDIADNATNARIKNNISALVAKPQFSTFNFQLSIKSYLCTNKNLKIFYNDVMIVKMEF